MENILRETGRKKLCGAAKFVVKEIRSREQNTVV